MTFCREVCTQVVLSVDLAGALAPIQQGDRADLWMLRNAVQTNFGDCIVAAQLSNNDDWASLYSEFQQRACCSLLSASKQNYKARCRW